jgi:ABC-type sulfate transport system permease subunit
MTLSMGPIGHRAANVVAIAVFVIWLYGALVLAERRSEHAIMLLGSVAGMVLFTVHVSRPGGLLAGLAGPFGGAVR